MSPRLTGTPSAEEQNVWMVSLLLPPISATSAENPGAKAGAEIALAYLAVLLAFTPRKDKMTDRHDDPGKRKLGKEPNSETVPVNCEVL